VTSCAADALSGTIRRVEDTEATQLMLEALFVVRAKVSEIHAVVVGVDDEEEDGEEEEEEDS
jgi:hypothetical protein